MTVCFGDRQVGSVHISRHILNGPLYAYDMPEKAEICTRSATIVPPVMIFESPDLTKG